MKRFYKIVTHSSYQGGFSILLDGKTVKTKAGSVLFAPTQALAQAVVLEWAGQVDHILPDTMPLTQIISTRIDRIPQERKAMSLYIQKYLDTDLICYMAQHPVELAARQEALWSAWRAWFAARCDVELITTTGLAPLKQPAQAHEYLQGLIAKMPDEHFTILQMVTPLCGSVILALAFVAGDISSQDLIAAFTIEEAHKDALYNAAKYGQDPMQEKKITTAQRDLNAAKFYLDHC